MECVYFFFFFLALIFSGGLSTTVDRFQRIRTNMTRDSPIDGGVKNLKQFASVLLRHLENTFFSSLPVEGIEYRCLISFSQINLSYEMVEAMGSISD